ncbi:hypothetical protein M758_4G025900 [Ceratodon purpureus]|nr:hypothetical protein M758_4G025900 [Ceratodon purpureus]
MGGDAGNYQRPVVYATLQRPQLQQYASLQFTPQLSRPPLNTTDEFAVLGFFLGNISGQISISCVNVASLVH